MGSGLAFAALVEHIDVRSPMDIPSGAGYRFYVRSICSTCHERSILFSNHPLKVSGFDVCFSCPDKGRCDQAAERITDSLDEGFGIAVRNVSNIGMGTEDWINDYSNDRTHEAFNDLTLQQYEDALSFDLFV
ncbi:MAG TPA: hypothetical protein VL092_04975 [Chitinophagaceae bacterium]|nr:hypothetical protein [Chitinophagaceae bacterium]